RHALRSLRSFPTRRSSDLSHVVLDRVSRVPGVFPAGSYRFLRPPSFLVEPGELRDIAANGLSELAPKDPSDPTSVDDDTVTLLKDRKSTRLNSSHLGISYA